MDTVVIAALVGAIATVVAAYITARAKDRQIKREWDETKNAVSARDSYLKVDYGVRITYPKGDVVSGDTIDVKGTYKVMPPPETLRLYTVSPERTAYGERFWPQEIVKEFFPDSKTWRARANISGFAKTGGAIVVAIVSQPAIVLWDFYYKVGPQIGWWDIEGWPNDSVVCERVPITRA